MPQLLPNGKQQFFYPNGSPLANGTVGMYQPNTLIPQTTWQDAAGNAPNQNPIPLDGNGQCVIYGTGTYRQIVKAIDGTTIWDQNVSDAIGSGTTIGSVDTIAALKALPVPTASVTYLVRGFAAAGDGGGGFYWWNTTDTTADNGGTVIQLNAGGNGRFNKLF